MLELSDITFYKFYNLTEDGWRIDHIKESKKYNKNILSSIASSFSNETGVDSSLIMRVFGDNVAGKSFETLLLLYTDKSYNRVYYELTYYNSDIYYKFQPKNSDDASTEETD